MSYSGPIKPPPQSNQMITRLLTSSNQTVANASGIISLGIGNSPNSATDWAGLAGLYTEFRTIGQRVRWIPLFTSYSTTSTPLLSVPLTLSLCRDSTISPPTTMATAIQFQPFKVAPVMQQQWIEGRMRGATDALWGNTAAPASTWVIFITAQGLTVSATYGYWISEFLVQFRNPQ